MAVEKVLITGKKLAAVVATGHQEAVVQTAAQVTRAVDRCTPAQPAPCYWSCLTTATGAG